MRIQPQDEKLAAGFAPVAGHAIHRTHRERVIAAEKDRDGPRSRQLVGPRTQFPRPALDFPVVLRIVGRRVRQFGHLADRDVAVIADFTRQPVEHGQKTGRSQRRRSHQGSALRRADIDRRAEQRNPARRIRFGGVCFDGVDHSNPFLKIIGPHARRGINFLACRCKIANVVERSDCQFNSSQTQSFS